MNDYKELIAKIRMYENYAGVVSADSITYKQAANSIEQLCTDVARLEAENRAKEQYIAETIGKVIKERDAAIADISSLALKRKFTFCDCCKNENSLKCVYCTDYLFTKPKFEWRGVREVIG